MADFQIALESTLKNEDSTLAGTITYDSGGETRFGIASKDHPEVYPEMGECSRDRALELAGQVLKQYWRFDGVSSQLVANQIFDIAVNAGLEHAVSFAQQAVGAPADGIWGPVTEAAVNAQNPDLVRNGIRKAVEAYHEKLALEDPEKYNAYLKGWINRDEREAGA